jgi:hypothetical protein
MFLLCTGNPGCSYFVLLFCDHILYVYACTSRGICDHKRERGMLFYIYYTPIEAISVVKPSKNNSLHSKLLAKTIVNIYS